MDFKPETWLSNLKNAIDSLPQEDVRHSLWVVMSGDLATEEMFERHAKLTIAIGKAIIDRVLGEALKGNNDEQKQDG